MANAIIYGLTFPKKDVKEEVKTEKVEVTKPVKTSTKRTNKSKED